MTTLGSPCQASQQTQVSSLPGRTYLPSQYTYTRTDMNKKQNLQPTACTTKSRSLTFFSSRYEETAWRGRCAATSFFPTFRQAPQRDLHSTAPSQASRFSRGPVCSRPGVTTGDVSQPAHVSHSAGPTTRIQRAQPAVDCVEGVAAQALPLRLHPVALFLSVYVCVRYRLLLWLRLFFAESVGQRYPL